jgi:hypothetical protein
MNATDPKIRVFARRFAEVANGSQQAMAIAREIYAEDATELVASFLEGFGQGKADAYAEIAANLRSALTGSLQVVPAPQTEDVAMSTDAATGSSLQPSDTERTTA